MIDYIKTYIQPFAFEKIKNLINNGTFSVVTNETDTDTGQILKEFYTYKNLIFLRKGKGLELKGSLHKFKSFFEPLPLHLSNEPQRTASEVERHGGFNGDIFTLSEINDTIHRLCSLLEICPSECVLQNVELGLNISVSFNPKEFLTGVLYHRNNYDFIVKFQGNYIQFCHAQYFLKLYNKSKQYALKTNILRVEIKVIKMSKLHTHGVELHSLNDINATTLKQAFDLLYKEFSEVVYYDHTTRTEALTEKQQQKAVQFQNKEYWRGLSRSERMRQNERLNMFISEFSNNMMKEIQTQMQEAFNKVLGQNAYDFTDPKSKKNVTILPTQTEQKTDPKNGKNAYDFTDPEKREMHTILPFKYSVNSYQKALLEIPQFLDLKKLVFEFEKMVANHPENYSENLGKKCKVTGLDLGLEKGGAKYIRTATFEFLKNHLSELYILLCSDLLPRTGYTPKRENNTLSQLCKQVRNRYNNPNKEKK